MSNYLERLEDDRRRAREREESEGRINEAEYARVSGLFGATLRRSDPIVVQCLEQIRRGDPTEKALVLMANLLAMTKADIMLHLVTIASRQPPAPILVEKWTDESRNAIMKAFAPSEYLCSCHSSGGPVPCKVHG